MNDASFAVLVEWSAAIPWRLFAGAMESDDGTIRRNECEGDGVGKYSSLTKRTAMPAMPARIRRIILAVVIISIVRPGPSSSTRTGSPMNRQRINALFTLYRVDANHWRLVR